MLHSKRTLRTDGQFGQSGNLGSEAAKSCVQGTSIENANWHSLAQKMDGVNRYQQKIEIEPHLAI